MPASTGIVDKNPANNTAGKHIHNYSTFDKSLSYRLYNTHRFGDYVPTFVMDGVPNDEISLNSFDKIDSLSLKAPFQGSIRKIKESFMVPNMAILPLQWDRIYAQPSNGDDVPLDANCIIQGFPTAFKNLWIACLGSLNTAQANIADSGTLATFLTGYMRWLVLGEFVLSSGSLLNVLGYKANKWLSIDQLDNQSNSAYQVDFDHMFDETIYQIFEQLSVFEVVEPVGGGNVTHQYFGLGAGVSRFGTYEQFRNMIELFRENPLCYFNGNIQTTAGAITTIKNVIQALFSGAGYGLLVSTLYTWKLPSSSYSGTDPLGGYTTDPTLLNPNILNLTRLLSYQLVVAHFYSNSSIDFVYSADLYRQYVYTLMRGINYNWFNTTNNAFFTYNGQYLPYDYLSGKYLIQFLALQGSGNVYTNFISNFCVNTNANLGVLAIWSAIFGFRKSLRYGDYFTASRPRPLAPINTDVSVAGSSVSVIDITRNIQAQRFANSVMRSRSKIEEYVKSLFGKAPQPDYHNPFFLTRQEEFIFGDQVQNTTQNINPQYPQSRTGNWTGNLSRHTFTFHNDDMHPCTYLQIVSYDAPRAYTRSVERQFLIADRFDMFNPDFQYIGDQPIYGIELGYATPTGIPNIFGYTTRDMEYKQRFDQVSSGFSSGSLPGWAFTDENLPVFFYGRASLNPDFIRSRNTDIDNLYLSLTGYSLGTYFHFTCITDNNVRAKRAMAVDPQILA